MRRFAVVLGLVATTSACTLWLALECPYDCDDLDAQLPDVVSTDAMSDADAFVADGGCPSGVTTKTDAGSSCLATLDLGEPVYAVAARAGVVYMLTKTGAVWTCSGACKGATMLAPGTDAGAKNTIALVDAGVVWASKNALMLASQGNNVAVVRPASALTIAASDPKIFWLQGAPPGAGIRSCTIGIDCLDGGGGSAGTLLVDAGNALDMSATAGWLVYADGTKMVATPSNKAFQEPANVVATTGQGIGAYAFWNATSDSNVHTCSLPSCATELFYDTLGSNGEIVQVAANAAGLAWVDSTATVGICVPSGVTGNKFGCTTSSTAILEGAMPATHPSSVAYDGTVLVYIDGLLPNARAVVVPFD